MPATKHILVFRFSAMGDVAMTVPVIKAVLSQNPGLTITFVSRPDFEGFFENIPQLTYFAADLNLEYKGFAGLIRLFGALKKNPDFDAVADLHDNLRSKILRRLFRLSGLPYVYIDKGREEKKLLTRFPNKILKPLKLTTERYADIFRKLGLQLQLGNQLKRDPRPLNEDIIKLTGEKNVTWIGIAPFAKHKGESLPDIHSL